MPISTIPPGSGHGTGAAASPAPQVKTFLPDLWYCLLVGVAASRPDLTQNLPRDVRLRDILAGLPRRQSPGLISYDLGEETADGFRLLNHVYVLENTEQILRSTTVMVYIEVPEGARVFYHITSVYNIENNPMTRSSTPDRMRILTTVWVVTESSMRFNESKG